MLVALPASLVTLMVPVVAASGTVAFTWVALTGVIVVASVPPNDTPVVNPRFVPVIVTCVPALPEAGVKDVIVGALTIEKVPALEPLPSGVVTLILPVVAPLGTIAVIDVSPLRMNCVAATPLNLTPPVRSAFVKLSPVIVTVLPIAP